MPQCTRAQCQLLELLRAYFTGSPPEAGLFEGADWPAVCREAQEQTVSGFAYTAMTRLPGELQPEAALRTVWQRETMRGYLIFSRFFERQDAFCRLLRENGVAVLIWKGLAAAAYLPEPELRTLGDVDALIPRGQMERAVAVLTANGYRREKDNDDDTEMHVALEKDGVHFELHRTVTKGVRLPDDYMTGCFARQKTVELAYGAFPAQDDTDHAFAMLLHMLRHFVSSGFGLRQLYDWAFCLQYGAVDRARLLDMARTAGAERFLSAATDLCIRIFGLSASHAWAVPVSEAACDGMLEDILIGGNWGRKEENRTYSLVFSENAGDGGEGRARQLRQMAAKMNRLAVELCPAAKEHPAVQPLLWAPALARFAYHVGTGRQQRPKIGQAKQIAERRIRTMRELGLESEQKRGS